jgi:dihydrofolate reductase
LPGGVQIYKTAMEYELFDYLYVTHVYGDFKCDVFLEPANFLENFKKVENFRHHSTDGYALDTMHTDPASRVQFKTIVYERR